MLVTITQGLLDKILIHHKFIIFKIIIIKKRLIVASKTVFPNKEYNLYFNFTNHFFYKPLEIFSSFVSSFDHLLMTGWSLGRVYFQDS